MLKWSGTHLKSFGSHQKCFGTDLQEQEYHG
jgi:hypothetical protein